MSASIKVINRSSWPTWLVRWLVRKACADAGVTQYTFTMKSVGALSSRTWGGRGGRYEGRAWCQRRALKAHRATWLFHYFRYKEENSCRDHIPHTTVALLAKIIRHEVEHAGEGHPRHFRKLGGDRDVWLMEMHCNEMAAKWVNGLDWPKVLREWLRLARAERQRHANLSPDAKVARTHAKHAEALATWERKLKLAQGKVKKYRRRLMNTERRIAALSHPREGE